MVSESSETKPSPLVSFIAGGTAGAAESFLTYPFEFAKTRVQLRNAGVVTSKNPFKVIGDIVRNEGLKALYKGCPTLVVGTIAKDGIRFLAFDRIKSAFADPETGHLSPLRSLLAGMSAGVVSSTFAVTPSERIKTALIDDARSSGARRFSGPLHASKLLIAERGFAALYQGYISTTLKQMGGTSVRLGSYSIIKDYETARDIEQTTAVNFGNGAFAGTVTAYATQPLDVIKTRAQSAKGAGMVEAFQSILADYGIKGMWKGTTMRLGRTVFSGGILFTVYEKTVALLNPLIPI